MQAARAEMGMAWEIAPEPPKGDKLEKDCGRCGSGGSGGHGGNSGNGRRGGDCVD